MTLPKWIEPRISLGTIATLVAMLATIWGAATAYGSLETRVAVTAAELTSVKASMSEQINAAAALLRDINADRVDLGKTMAELKTDVSYLRKWVEDLEAGERNAR